VASGLSVLLIPLLYHSVGLPLAALLALVAAGALLDAPGQTAREAILPELVERAETTIERGASLLDGVSRGARMIGAPVAGVLIARYSTRRTSCSSTRQRLPSPRSSFASSSVRRARAASSARTGISPG
jgi:hypothetical protein